MRYIQTLVLVILSLAGINAQDTTQLQSYEVTVTGSSTLHDWTVQVPDVEGYLLTGENEIENAVVRFKVETMDGGRGASMNDKIKKALSNETHPWITFEADEVTVAGDKIQAKGSVDIGGVKKKVDVPIVNSEDGGSVYTGEVELTFSEFNITPPSAMFGQIKCGDRVSLQFKLTF